VLKTTALIAALESGKVKAAGLDVLENEKINTFNEAEKQWFDALIKDERIILTPHIAGWTVESKRKIAEVIISALKGFGTL
jgi:D-3-phosphoglycerate dehydrogenase